MRPELTFLLLMMSATTVTAQQELVRPKGKRSILR